MPAATVRVRSLVSGVVLVLAILLTACAPSDDPGDDPEPEADAPTVEEPDPEDPGDDQDDGEPVAAPEADPDLTVAVALTEVHRMTSPVAGTVGPDGTLYLAERAGTVHPITGGQLGDPVVDVSELTTVDNERGLLGIAFAADGTEFYASYTDRAGDSVLAAYAVENDRVDGDSRRTVMAVAQPFGNHNGGDVSVGPDDLLYWGLGDGGGGGDPEDNGQDLATPLGALLRIDPEAADPYGVPSGNPFVATDGAAPEVWAYGLRNPWRFSFDAAAGDLWIADVGQNSLEEINRIPADEAGANFGWNLMEGTQSFAGNEPDDHVAPVHTYATSSSRCAITGGYVYRGEAIPELVGAYLFSDFCEGDVRAIIVDDDGSVTGEANLDINGGNVVSFVEDADGELLVLDLGGGVSQIVAAE
jgi:glucose/arabinose dehydrogenase